MREELIKNLRTAILDLCVDAAAEIENLEGMLKESEAARAELGKHLAATQKELHEAKSELAAMRNELCYLCGKYREAHNGACDGCRWNSALAGKDGDM